MNDFFLSFLRVVCEMAPYLLLGFFIAGVLHVFVPQKFYSRYLSKQNKLSVLWAALLGVPLPLCSCGVIPTAIGLRNEKASKGAIASFLIATPQTGIDSILATFSLMGLGFAIVRPVAALITGICGGLLVNRLVRDNDTTVDTASACETVHGSKLWRVLRYAYYEMIRDIGGRLVVGLLVAALIQVAVPDEFFLSFGHQPLLQMLVILAIAVPMYICSTGSIPVAAALMMKGLSPGAALVMLMAGPAVNLASILVVHKSMGRRFTSIYLLTIVGFAVIFGLLLNATGWEFYSAASADACCMGASTLPSPFKLVCATVLTLLIVYALVMKLFGRFSKKTVDPDTAVYRVEDMHCSHCEAAVVRAVENVPGVESAKASASAKTLTVKGPVTEEAIRSAVENIGYTFKGKA
ncbi:MAG: permease [Prevotella sp.]|nr:permease [Prevotella sp.]MBR6997289.1 permease [Prevotella sp.]